ncbi:hypothetical protein B0H15DRAFT_24149 [Mycena belliarum]|uniref:Uncharacterized protein n=1 Tax=Mycena belliarum TaxID=1033014 RepID=A0AAD6UNA1_9AGAR|nr:hypothetical protein B0H15DRAFT_24149 [Mycena belliae]
MSRLRIVRIVSRAAKLFPNAISWRARGLTWEAHTEARQIYPSRFPRHRNKFGSSAAASRLSAWGPWIIVDLDREDSDVLKLIGKLQEAITTNQVLSCGSCFVVRCECGEKSLQLFRREARCWRQPTRRCERCGCEGPAGSQHAARPQGGRQDCRSISSQGLEERGKRGKDDARESRKVVVRKKAKSGCANSADYPDSRLPLACPEPEEEEEVR